MVATDSGSSVWSRLQSESWHRRPFVCDALLDADLNGRLLAFRLAA